MRHIYAGPHEKRVDFWLGFAGWFALNLAAVGAVFLVSMRSNSGALGLSALLVLLNVGIPIVLAFTRRYAALGVLLAFASLFALTIVEGIFSTVSDFVGFAGGLAIGGTAGGNFIGGTLIVVGILVLIGFVLGAFFVLRRISRSL